MTSHYIHDIYPGQTTIIHIAAVGQRQGLMPSFVIASVTQTDVLGGGKIHESQFIQNVDKECTSMQYTVFSSRD